VSKEKKEWKRRIKMYCKLCLVSAPFLSADVWLCLFVPQWVPQLKRSDLDGSFLAQRRRRPHMHPRMRAIGTRLRGRHSRSSALTKTA